MENIMFKPVGKVVNTFDSAEDYREIKSKPSTIKIFDEFSDALLGIEAYRYFDIVFCFHKSESKLQTATLNHPDVVRGVFSTRSPKRPNLIGVTSVELIRREGNSLVVNGLDALNNTPVLDIKNADTSLFAYTAENNPAHKEKLKNSPRIDIRNDIHANRLDNLMIKAAAMHGHYCPGLALGIMAATHAMNCLETDSDGMEDVLAITETNNCFADGIQFVTACTFGNNALIFKDLGKIAVTLTKRDGKGIRVSSKANARDVIRAAFPDYHNLYEKVVADQNRSPELLNLYQRKALERAFGVLTLDFHKLFDVKTLTTNIPAYAQVHESIICNSCGESTMATRMAENKSEKLCYRCAGANYNSLDGNGIRCGQDI